MYTDTGVSGDATLSVRWVSGLQSIQHCAHCGDELAHGESAKRQVLVSAGEFFCLYVCSQCTNGEKRRKGRAR